MTRTSWTAALAVLYLLGATRPATASLFTVNPTQIFLAPKTTSALLTLRNESDHTLRFQLTVFTWDQTPQGEMKLEPTQDIVFFPAFLSLAPKEERKIRVGAATPFAAAEKTYRIFVEELPPQAGAVSQNAVRVLTKVGIPIFLQPAKVQAQATLNDLMVKNGVFTFAVRNTGNVHFVPQTVRVQGTNAAGQVVVDKQVEGWYILSGGMRAYELPLPPECRTITALAVTVQVGSTSVKERLETPVTCSP